MRPRQRGSDQARRRRPSGLPAPALEHLAGTFRDAPEPYGLVIERSYRLLDLLPTWMAADGHPIPAPLPGRVLTELFSLPPVPRIAEPAAVTDTNPMPGHSDDMVRAGQLLARAEQASARGPEVHNRIAYTLLRLRRWDQALGRYDQTLALAPDDLGAHLGKPCAPLALRRFAQTRDQAVQAIRLDFHRPLGHDYLGLALARLGDPKAALKALKIAATQALGSGALARIALVVRAAATAP